MKKRTLGSSDMEISPIGLGTWAIGMGVIAGSCVALISFLVAAMDSDGSDTLAGAGGFDPDDTLFLIGPMAWLGWLQPFLVIAAIGAPVFLVYVLVLWRRHITKRRNSNGEKQ